MKKKNVLSSVALAALIGMSSCASSQKSTGEVNLAGEWKILEVNGEKLTNAEETPFIGFNMEEKMIYGSTGCNNMMGEFHLDAAKGKVSFGNTGSTRRMCQHMESEQAILSVLNQIKQFKKVTDKSVSLENGEGKQLMLIERK